MNAITAPFPWYGGKRRWANLILERFGKDADSYIEPFAGSLAVLLHNPNPYPREIVCDINGLLCNFWRAIKFDPEQTAYWAEWPTIHLDLTARHKWMVEWELKNVDSLRENPEYCDPKAAGWWCWGVSNWIGGGFCASNKISDKRYIHDKRPHVDARKGGQGIQAQRTSIKFRDKIPHVDKKGGQGIQAQRTSIKFRDKIPHVDKKGGQGIQAQRTSIKFRDKIPHVDKKGGQGIQAQRTSIKFRDQRPHVAEKKGGQGIQAQRDYISKNTIFDWFDALSQRLQKVVVINREWKSAISPTILGDVATHKGKPVIFLDPPYLTSNRASILYESDMKNTRDKAALESYEWALERGDQYRIAYACHEGDFPVPNNWDAETITFTGTRDNKKMDMIMFSPACLKEGEGGLLDEFFPD